MLNVTIFRFLLALVLHINGMGIDFSETVEISYGDVRAERFEARADQWTSVRIDAS